jgi:hypothetical protein
MTRQARARPSQQLPNIADWREPLDDAKTQISSTPCFPVKSKQAGIPGGLHENRGRKIEGIQLE